MSLLLRQQRPRLSQLAQGACPCQASSLAHRLQAHTSQADPPPSPPTPVPINKKARLSRKKVNAQNAKLMQELKEAKDTLKQARSAAAVNSKFNTIAELQSQLDDLRKRIGVVARQALVLQQQRSEQQQAVPGWGPDKLAPPEQETPTTEQAAPAESEQQPFVRGIPPHMKLTTSSSSNGNNNNKARNNGPQTKILSGQAALSSSVLSLRDAKGQLIQDKLTYAPSLDDAKWNETVRGSLGPSSVPITKIPPLREMHVPALANGLDRVLFNPGVYWLREPRSGIYNFDPSIRNILDVDLFDYAALPPYITSSKDPELATLTKQHGKKFSGSTSSMTGLLSQCYFHISGWRDPDTSGFSAPFQSMPAGYSAGAHLPASIILNYLPGGTYAIDADKAAAGESENSNYVLASLGKSMEKMLTSTPEEYAKYMRVNSHKLTEEERTKPEAYHYASTDKMMMRSQLDCQDPRLPRKTFDLKTRASVGIRHDRANYVEGSGYQIRRATGLFESFEREYFDMIRAAFLKYNFQARIGHMDGIFVAYHTTSRIYGFQYISVEEMNARLFGSEEMAKQAFTLSLGMMEAVLEAAVRMFPEQTVKITTESRADGPMGVWVEPAKPIEGSRNIVQLDISVDRFLDGSLVKGPVDFSALPGRFVDPMTDDEIARRQVASLPPVKWEIDYSINPNPTMSEDEARANLEAIRVKQRSISSLLMPNIEALNERERFRESELSSNPEALKRFLEERANGVAAGMPLAPGQESAAEPELKTETRWKQMRTERAKRMRDLAKLGAEDSKLGEKLDELVMYSPQP